MEKRLADEREEEEEGSLLKDRVERRTRKGVLARNIDRFKGTRGKREKENRVDQESVPSRVRRSISSVHRYVTVGPCRLFRAISERGRGKGI